MTIKHLSLALLLCFVALSLAGCAEPVPGALALSVPVEVASYSGASVKSGHITLYDEVIQQADGSDHVVLEAEQYDDVFWQPAVRTTSASEQWMQRVQEHGQKRSYPDEAASGGAYLERVSSATYPFMVSRGGTYTVWMRLWRPGKQSWVFRYQVDGSDMVMVKLDAEQYKTYYWQETGTVELQPGSHLFAFKDLHNGKRIDKIVLTRKDDFVPEGAGPDASPRKPTDRGSVTFKACRPAGVSAFMGLDIPTVRQAGRAAGAVSLDGGKTWHDAGDNSLVGQPVTARDGVQVKLELVRTGGKAPVVGIPEVKMLAPGELYPTLGDDRVRYTFDATRGCLAGIELLSPEHRVVMPRGAWREPIRVMYRKKAEPQPVAEWFEFDDFKLVNKSVGSRSVSFTFRATDAAVEVTTDYRLNPAGYLDASVTLANRGLQHDLPEVEVLRLGPRRIGDDGADDSLIWPVATCPRSGSAR